MALRVFNDQDFVGKGSCAESGSYDPRRHPGPWPGTLIAATGRSQFEFLAALTEFTDIDWGLVEVFHLDEYVGLPATHPASFRKILLERLVNKAGIAKFHPLDGDASDLSEVIRKVGKALASAPVDIAFVGIGENGHLAFNDPPADFETEEPYLIVTLDEACRRQQVGEAWFSDISQVPKQAISMSIRQIMKAKEILAVVPDSRKAQAVKACLRARSVRWRLPQSCARTPTPTCISTGSLPVC